MLLKLRRLSDKSTSDIDVEDGVFGIKEINKIAIAQVIRWQMQKNSGFTSYTKTRSEVRGSGKKIYRQKGTGNARHSDKYAPQFRKGGVAHGPKGVQWTMSVPKKVKCLALKHSLSSKAEAGSLMIIDTLQIESAKTREVVNMFSDVIGKKILFIDNMVGSHPLQRAINNLVGFNYLPVVGLNVYDIIRSDIVVIAKDALETISKRLLA